MPATTRPRVSAFFLFVAITLLAIPAAIAAVSLIAGRTDACLLAVAEDHGGFICELGLRFRYHP